MSYVLRNSLKAKGYQVSKEGLEEALRVKYAGVTALVGSQMEYIYGDEAISGTIKISALPATGEVMPFFCAANS
ncbi:unnamed protein product, partial [marine sediment metagenome]